MPYTHVFATHAILQERLAAAIVAQAGIPPENVLILKVRGSYRADPDAVFTTLNGGRYMRMDGWNLPKHRWANQTIDRRFSSEVLAQLAPGFSVYAAMYTYWFVRLLRERAGAYHILEDGIGSYQTREEFDRIFAGMAGGTWRAKAASLRTRLVGTRNQYLPVADPVAVLCGADRYYVTSPHCFPFIEEERRVVLREVFPPDYVGAYPGATVLATSSLPENDQMPLPVYLDVVRGVLEKLVARGVRSFYYKLHPVQARHPTNGPVYQRVLSERPELEAIPLGQEVSLEALAAGNTITLVTGVSTLGLHVAAMGRPVLNYHADLEAAVPGCTSYLAAGGVAIFHRVTRPL